MLAVEHPKLVDQSFPSTALYTGEQQLLSQETLNAFRDQIDAILKSSRGVQSYPFHYNQRQGYSCLLLEHGGDTFLAPDKEALHKLCFDPVTLAKFHQTIGDDSLVIKYAQINFMTQGQFSQKHNHTNRGCDYIAVIMLEPTRDGGKFYTQETFDAETVEHDLQHGDTIIFKPAVFHGTTPIVGEELRVTLILDFYRSA